jgi:hypothetical protein
MIIEATTSLIFLATAIYLPVNQTPVPTQAPATERPVSVEKRVKEYYKDIPLLIKIAGCESQFRQFAENGEVIRGEVNNKDVGVMQINETYHAKQAEVLGLDLNTTEGNMAYAKILYKTDGLTPWLSSSKCWAKNPNPINQLAVANVGETKNY